MKKSAFTLIELLVVIAIIAILASLAIPALSKAMERAKVTQDANNLKSLGIAFVSYGNDNDDTFPQPQGAGGGDAGGATTAVPWTTALNPKYIQSWKVFQSPFDNKRSAVEDAAKAPVSFGMNINLAGKSTSDVASPSACLLLSEDMTFTGTAQSPNPLSKASNGSGPTGGPFLGGKQINVLFVDSHVAAVSMATFHAGTPNSQSGGTPSDILWNK